MRAVLVAATVVLVTAPCFSQAWVAPRGETNVSLGHHFSDFLGHLDHTGKKLVDVGPSQSQGISLGVDYSVTDRLALSFSVPFTLTRNGKQGSPSLGRTGIDDGRYHGAWQDYHFEARYNVLTRPVMLTPFVTYVLPTHDYAAVGEAGVGRNLRELRVGFDAGRLLDPVLPNAYFHARIGHSFAEKFLGIRPNRSTANLEIGYFVTPRFTSRFLAHGQYGHEGLTGDVVFGQLPPDGALFREHDRILKDSNFRVGLGASYAVSEKVDVSAALITIVSGRDTHYGNGVSLSVSRTFAGAR